MFDFFAKDLFPGIKEFVQGDISMDEILSVKKQTVSSSHDKEQEIAESNLMEDVKESLYFLRKINFVELFSHIQKGQETLVAKFQKLEDNQAHIAKKIIENERSVKDMMSSLAKAPKNADEDKPAHKMTQSLAAENELLMMKLPRKTKPLKCSRKKTKN